MGKSYWNVGSLDIMVNFKSSEILSPTRPLIVSSRNPASRFELVSKITALHVHHAFSSQRFLCRPCTSTTWKWTHFKLTWESQGGKFYWLSTLSHLYCYNLISLHETWWLGIMANNVEQREVNLIFKQRSDREVPNYNGCVGDQGTPCYFSLLWWL